jgi:CRISPR-associated protein Csm1
LNTQDSLHLAALLHDIGKFRQRATERYKQHQEHSYEFVNEDFAEFFAPCGDTFKNAIRHHHRNPDQLEHLVEKQVILADRLSATEREDEEREAEDFVVSALVSPLSRLECATKEYRYPLTALNLEDRNTIIPVESVEVNRETYAKLWNNFKKAFHKATDGKSYTPADYQTIGALLHKYTSRIPSATPWEKGGKRTVPDISLYDHLRTTAAIAACIGRELSETEVDEELKLLIAKKESDRKICALIKGDISGIQNFLYHILSDGASNQLRGRSFYLQLLTEAIAHWVLRQLDLPITNLLLASGGHFFILAPYTESKEKLNTIRQTISKKLWQLHQSELSCILAGISMKAHDFKADNFPSKWDAVAGKVNERKLKKWSEMEAQEMFDNLFEPQDNREVNWQFDELGRKLRHDASLVAFEVPESPEKPNWHAAIKTFGLDIDICTDSDQTPTKPEQAERAVVYQLGDTNFLSNIEKYQWEDIQISYDFRIFRPVIPHRHDRAEPEAVADYDYLANASEGVKWLGALRMDVDDLGSVFKDKLGNATISRHASLSQALRHFFEGYVPQLCHQYNKEQDKEILELIYAGGDDLFLVGGWSALPEIAEKIRSEFHDFVTGDHVTLSGGIAIEHMKFPLYQFADRSGDAEKDAKACDGKNAITFLQKPMKWKEFAEVREWHQKLLESLTGQNQLPRDILTRLTQIYSEKELKEHRWAWRSLYYFHRLLERYKYDEQKDFLSELKQKLNHEDSSQFREELIHVITRWTALRIRKKGD